MGNLIAPGAVQKKLFVSEVRKRDFAGATAGDMAGGIPSKYQENISLCI
jgi:hypothetical protein